MRKMFLIAMVGIAVNGTAHAQSYYGQRTYTAASDVNGFRTASEENAHMERALAERRKKEQEDEYVAMYGKAARTHMPKQELKEVIQVTKKRSLKKIR